MRVRRGENAGSAECEEILRGSGGVKGRGPDSGAGRRGGHPGPQRVGKDHSAPVHQFS